MKLILDTNLYFSMGKKQLENTRFEIVGTQWNAWELGTSSAFTKRKFTSLQGAVNKFLCCTKEIQYQTPMNYFLGDYLKSKRLERSRDLYYDRWLRVLIDIKDSKSYDKCPIKDEIEKFRLYDNNARKSIDSLLVEVIKKHKELRPKLKVFSRFTAYIIIIATMRCIVKDWYYKQMSIGIIESKINLNWESPFVQAMLDYLRLMYEKGYMVKRNTFNDLMFFVYLLNPDYYFSTYEKDWIKICLANSFLKERFIHPSKI